MKKKFGLWLNIVTICLCVCAIAIGVYSATTATLNVGGKIAFTAHGCTGTVSGTIIGHSNTIDGEPIMEAEALNGGNAVDFGTANGLPLGDRYFSDIASADGSAEDIVITLTVTNTSAYKITATFDSANTTVPTGVTITSNQTALTLEANGTTGASAEFEVTLSLNKDAENIAMPTGTTNNITIAMLFAKYAKTEFAVENGKLYVNMGTDPDTGNPIRWYAIAKDNATLQSTTFTNVSQATAGTYVFISEYILENRTGGNYMVFNASCTADNNYGANYNGSTVQQYVNGIDSNSINARYNFSSSPVYSQITLKDCEAEEITDVNASEQPISPATDDQTLWLLSSDEYFTWLGDGDYDGSALGIAMHINNPTTADSWWLRSPEEMFGESSDTYIRSIDSAGDAPWYGKRFGDDCGVRPAFQIVIA